MLLFDDTKRLEKALGEEAAAVIAHIFEKVDAKARQELATKADLDVRLAETEAKLSAEIASVRLEIARCKAETLKWVAGLLMAQAAVIATLVKLL